MGWTTSYRWEGYTRDSVKGLLRHDVRDVERDLGIEVSHSNTMIDPSITAMNVSKVYDPDTGEMKPMESVDDALDVLDRRLAESQNFRITKWGETVPVSLRKDANCCVEFILELDPEYTRDPSISADKYFAIPPEERVPDAVHMDAAEREEVQRLLYAMRDQVREELGPGNTVYVIEHWDESHPHIQMGMVPRTDDGQISMNKVLGAPSKGESQAKYKAMHDRMRERLRDEGYDASFDRVSAGKRHLPLAEFKAQQDKTRQVEIGLRKIEAKERQTNQDLADAARERREAKADRAAAAEELATAHRELATAQSMREKLAERLTAARQDAEEAADSREHMSAATTALINSQKANLRAYLNKIAPGWEEGFKASQAAKLPRSQRPFHSIADEIGVRGAEDEGLERF